ncbi:MAG: lipoprotein signal peptidase [Burkholderiaceae bacterium]|nr:MAG: lipoprotein signal peptidase [Burkholderiaceae bacterium]
MASKSTLTPWLMLSSLVILLDQLTKILVARLLQHGDSVPIINHFNLVLAYNKGAAFSFLAQSSGWQKYFFIALGVAASLFMLYLLSRHGGQKIFAFALALIMGGALGNVIDRIWHGHVIDFVDFFIGSWHFPAFNLADSAITLGAVLLVLDELRRVRRTG